MDVVGFSGVVYAMFGFFFIQFALFMGFLVYTYLVKPGMKKFGFVTPLFVISGCFLLLWAFLDVGNYIRYNDFSSMYEGNPINFFGHLSGLILGVILALLLEKIPDRVDDLGCEEQGI